MRSTRLADVLLYASKYKDVPRVGSVAARFDMTVMLHKYFTDEQIESLKAPGATVSTPLGGASGVGNTLLCPSSGLYAASGACWGGWVSSLGVVSDVAACWTLCRVIPINARLCTH